MRRSIKMLFVGFLFALVGVASAQEREIVIAQGIDIPGFDVHDHNTTAVEAVHVNLFDYLVMRDRDGELQPALATAWEQDGETAWRFTLREGVLWHDGETFTAEDVKFTLERVATDTSLQEHNNYNTIREVEVVSDYEVVIHTHEPDPILLNRLSRIGSSILPKHHIEAVGWDGFATDPIGTGPFRFVQWIRDDRVILEAFDDHWRGRPVWDRLVHRTIPEDSTRVGELLTGGVHIATNIPVQDSARVEASGQATLLPWPTPRVMMFLVNTEEGRATSDPRVREAIDYAINDQLLVDAVMGGLGAPTLSRVTPGIDAAPMELYGAYNYDPERAAALLEEAGYGPGELEITLQGPLGRYPLDSELLEITGALLQEVGINARVEVLEWSAYLERVWDAENIENLGFIGLSNSMFDASLALTPMLCGGTYFGRTGWCNEDFDALVNEGLVELDPERRAELFAQAFDILVEERPMITLFQLENQAGVSTEIIWEPRLDELLWMYEAEPAS
ncbi:ABC transporter substrate-binding protein [Truepera radiovictrix]|uniref:Extracellular solute-binding protein family 5 n=1 Tax=Truepera radiovictrix (strain DSM 17093 / CIP 108686 / LMG 22925 / RQ-24) TaxID=649638 RepID=D7CUT4_TRURR|nr:ABC transporter substrate-binding protein [Truepera radiovictrix]ADI14075.1 extracellular solute-binding protein family 5 [Truepera radiovictrix DSM 17093]WMT57363.1 ABC transporter substrate-binding protein [Truepera radiovictrix]